MEIEVKSILDSIKGSVESFGPRIDAVQRQVDAIDANVQNLSGKTSIGGPPTDGLDLAVKTICEAPGFDQLRQSGRGRVIVEAKLLDFERKSTPLTSGSLVPYMAVPGIADSGRPLYGRVRRLLRELPIETGSAAFVRETAISIGASPQIEAEAKGETSFTLTADTAPVRTIAHYTGISRQIFDDLTALQEFLRSSLLYGLEKVFETELLAGSGVGEHFNGLCTQATSFDSSLLTLIPGGAFNIADVLRTAILQLAESGFACTGIVISPRDWMKVETLKSSVGEYLIGAPQRTLGEILWSLPIVPSPAMTPGSFLCGDFDGGAHIRMRMAQTIDISDSHSDWFIRNLLCLRAEMRAALVVTKPGSFVTGSLVSSPA